MAAIAGTVVVGRQPLGQYELVVIRTSAIGTAAADEWVAAATIGCSYIRAIIGSVVIGATTSTVGGGSFMKNAQGTGVAEGTNPGDLGVESTDAAINVLEITLLVTV
jgi:hypothetical protein